MDRPSSSSLLSPPPPPPPPAAAAAGNRDRPQAYPVDTPLAPHASSLAKEQRGTTGPQQDDAAKATRTAATAATGATMAGKTGGVVDDADGSATLVVPSSSASQNFATIRKVQKLLDININDNFRELVLYMNDAVPEFLECHLPSSDRQNPAVQKEDPHSQHTSSAAVSSSMALRTALEGRIVVLHRRFLQEWSTLNELYEDVSDMVSKLHQEAEVLETTLNAHAVRAERFVGLMTTMQAELSLVQQREKEIKEFQAKYHFAKEEQDLLEEGPVDTTYLDILKRAQMIHRKCRELLLSREHYQSAATMMDITYTAIMKGTGKIARYLMSVSAAAAGTATGVAAFGGDSPEVTSFYLQCVQFLREENVGQWAAVVEEVARLRRAAVLRQYFHLMTTGSATTSAGTYRGGGGGGGKTNGELAGSGGDSSSKNNHSSSGARPLEAEINNPTFFFSALFAWLHQVIVDEDDFFTPFFNPHSQGGETDANTAGATLAHGDVATARNSVLTTVDETATLDEAAGEATVLLSKAKLLDSIFEVLCKHIYSVLEGVLERFLRSASSLQDGDSSSSSSSVAGGGARGGGAKASMGLFRPMGLTGGITRLLNAATGRAASLGSDASSGAHRYQHVMNRSQQEALVAASLMSLTNGLCTAHTLLQLFTYYTYSTFIALLGRDSALTRLVADDAKLQLLRVYNTIAKLIVEHTLDSVVSLVSSSTVLRRLASAEAMEAAEGANQRGGEATYFVTEFLLEHAVDDEEEEERENELFEGACEKDGGREVVHAEAGEPYYNQHQQQQQQHLKQHQEDQEPLFSARGGSSGVGDHGVRSNPYHRSGLSKHQAQAADLLRRLRTMILPAPPEVEECLRVLRSTMIETEKHVEIMESVQALQSKSVPRKDHVAAAVPAHHEQFFTVLLQHVLSFPVVLARQPILSTTLDEPCKLTLQLNTMAALQDTLAPHLGLLAHGNAPPGHTTPLSNVVPERVQQLTRQLTTRLSHCLVRYYFHRRLSTTMSPTLATARGDDELGSSSIIGGEKNEIDEEQLDIATITAQLSGFYSAVAASGRVYIPLIAALRFPRLREQVAQGVLQSLCDVYEARYRRLLELQPKSLDSRGVDEPGTALPSVVSDLDPRKLRILLDTALWSSP